MAPRTGRSKQHAIILRKLKNCHRLSPIASRSRRSDGCRRPTATEVERLELFRLCHLTERSQHYSLTSDCLLPLLRQWSAVLFNSPRLQRASSFFLYVPSIRYENNTNTCHSLICAANFVAKHKRWNLREKTPSLLRIC